jgi:hypothetical protein|tara:strand:- start:9854 stop:10249 length:396 start_codon:yes stop_codon:yes gene_type:complete
MFGRKHFERVVCADGFSVSVQAADGSYCSPRNSVGPWESVECGFPTAKDPVLEAWAEDPRAGICKDTGHVQTVYGWVPSQVILRVIESHGGMVSGELPEMVPDPECNKAEEAADEMMDTAAILFGAPPLEE